MPISADATVSGDIKHRYRWVILGVLWVTYVVVFLNRLCIGPLGPFIKESLHVTNAQIGLVLSAASSGYLLTQIPVGWLVDRVGARWPIVIGEVAAGLATTTIFSLPTYASLLTLMFVSGMACGFLAPSTTQAVVVWFPKSERATVMGFKQTAVNIGGILSAVSLPVVAVRLGWRYGFLFLGITAIAVGLTSLALYREPPTPAFDGPQAAPGAGVSMVDILTSREIWLVALGGFCLNCVELAIVGHFVTYLTTALAFPVVAAGGLLGMVQIAGAIGRPVSGLVSDRMFAGRRKPVFVFCAAISAAMCFVLAIGAPHLGSLLYPVVFLLGVGAIGFGGVFLTLLSELGGQHGAAKAAGVGNTIAMGGSVLGPVSFGYVVDVTGSYECAWLSLAGISLLGVVLLLCVRERTRAAVNSGQLDPRIDASGNPD